MAHFEISSPSCGALGGGDGLDRDGFSGLDERMDVELLGYRGRSPMAVRARGPTVKIYPESCLAE